MCLPIIRTKKGKYGRYLAEPWVINSSSSWQNVNDMMIQSGHASYYGNEVKAVAYDVNEIALDSNLLHVNELYII
ncbi:MAG: thermonuclease family protein [Gammaproteobacteria bacterium]|nr:thermonuclease family protein [Gammaproteobacteria bacterium]